MADIFYIYDECDSCGGTGQVIKVVEGQETLVDCGTCSGTGLIKIYELLEEGDDLNFYETCKTCKGTGTVINGQGSASCVTCAGTGKIKKGVGIKQV